MRVLILILTAGLSLADVVFTGNIAISGDFVGVSGELSAPNKAGTFSPVDDATHVSIDPTLSWSPAGGATSYDVYFDTVNPPLVKVVDAVNQFTYEPDTLDYGTVYYWRVDPKNSIGTTTGDVYSFTTTATIDADLLADFETDSAGTLLTATVLGNASHGSIGTWSASTNAQTYAEISSEELALWSPFVVSAVTYVDGSGTRGVRFRQDQQTNYANLVLTSPVDALTVGTWINLDTFGSFNNQLDLIHIANGLGGFFVLQTDNSFNLRAHGDGNGTSLFGDPIDISAGTWYWVTMDYVRAGVCTVRVYDTVGVQVGSDSTVDIFRDSAASSIIFGRTDAHSSAPQPPNTSWIYFDDFTVDVTDATFPLGP